MSGTPSAEDLARQFAVLEERMNTKQQEYRSDIAQLTAKFSEFKEDMAKRELRLVLTIGGLIALAATVLGFLIRFPV